MARSNCLLWGMMLLASSTHINAATIDSNTTIDAENSFPDEGVVVVDGEDPPTIVDILPGATIGPSSSGSALTASGTSIVTVFGGTINGPVHVQVDATLNLVDLDPGTVVDGVRASGNATFNMSGGQVGLGTSSDHQIRVLSGSPTLNISGGVIASRLITQDASGATINFTGGEVTGFMLLRRRTTANWWGGSINRISVWDDSDLHVYGFDLAISDDRLERLTGRLADGTQVDLSVDVRDPGTATIHLHEVTDTPGDSFPLDGTVDIDDLNQVRNHFGQGQMGGEPVPGDTFPFDGIVDVNDLNRIRNHFGATRPPMPVPEPATGALLFLGMAAIIAASRLRRFRKRCQEPFAGTALRVLCTKGS